MPPANGRQTEVMPMRRSARNRTLESPTTPTRSKGPALDSDDLTLRLRSRRLRTKQAPAEASSSSSVVDAEELVPAYSANKSSLIDQADNVVFETPKKKVVSAETLALVSPGKKDSDAFGKPIQPLSRLPRPGKNIGASQAKSMKLKASVNSALGTKRPFAVAHVENENKSVDPQPIQRPSPRKVLIIPESTESRRFFTPEEEEALMNDADFWKAYVDLVEGMTNIQLTKPGHRKTKPLGRPSGVFRK